MRILIAEDDAVSRRLLEVTLRKWEYEVISCEDGQKSWEEAQKEDAPKLMILDWMMPRMDGVEVCRRIRQLPGRDYSYIILLTAKGQTEDIIEGLEAGADDYITKPFNRQELRVRLRAGRRIIELQESLLTAKERLQEQATHDSLTGLWNRAAIYDILSRELSRAKRDSENLAVMIADLDHFKQINDTHGHLAGDEVLKQAAGRMRASLRDYDSIARYGGEEFLCVVPGCSTTSAAELAERVRLVINSEPIMTKEAEVQVAISLGVSSTADFPNPDVDTLIRVADSALYRAKRQGRNRVELADESDL